MQVPKNIKVTNAIGQTVAFLSPKADGLKDCYPDTRLNGESTLEFSLPATSEKIEELAPECEIWTNDRVYILRKDDAVDIIRDDKNKLWAKFSAIEKWAELDSDYVEGGISNDPSIPTPSDLSVTIVGGGSNLSGGLYPTGTAGHALYAVLQGSGWTLGTVDVTGIRDLEMEKVSLLELIKQIQNIWGGYLVWDSVNKIVHLRDANKWQNYTGFQVRYRKNLKHITRTQSNKLVTKLYAFGHDDLDIASVNGGKKYVTNYTCTTKEYVGVYKNQDIYDQSELKEKTITELELICRPRYLYKVKLVDLRTLPEYAHEDFSLGDMADIIDPGVALDSPRPRIIRHKYDLFKPWNCELDIGDPEERLIEQLKASFNTSGFIDGKFNGNGDMSGNYLEDMTVGNAKIKNLSAEKITTGFLDADRIKAGSISIGKVDDGFVSGLNLLDNLVFSSYAQQVSKIDGKVTSQATLIQQNAEQISLQAIDINGLGSSIAKLDIKADSIISSVASVSNKVTTNYNTLTGEINDISYDVSRHESSITQLATSITSKVSTTDYTGAKLVSMIEQTSSSIKLSASKIDLAGITAIYDPTNLSSYARINGSVLELHKNNQAFFYVAPNASGTEIWSKNQTLEFYTGIYVKGLAEATSLVVYGNADFRGSVTGLTLKFA